MSNKPITTTDYILKSLRKIAHKEWELFITSRIVHQLDDDIEFVTQQLVHSADVSRYLTDLFLPEFNLHLEVNERHRLAQKERDQKREADISHSFP